MSPAFSSFAAFLNMGGYGVYVWLAVAVTVAPVPSSVVFRRASTSGQRPMEDLSAGSGVRTAMRVIRPAYRTAPIHIRASL